MGFAGIRIHVDHISFTPHLPPTWKGFKFAVYFRGARLRVSMTHTKTDVMIERAPKRRKIYAEVYGKVKRLNTHKFVTFEAKEA